MKVLLILNDPPYGTERCYNGLRLAGSLAKREGHDVRVFLMGDASSCAKAGQAVPNGWYNLNRMLTVVLRQRGAVGVCGSCMDARGLSDTDLLKGTRRSSLEELTDWTEWADRVITF
ncbi:MAG: DsrE family protein [Gemmatimonadetes bacterium]|nr:DsrE family protein [Gemmatimonadota bacterium]